MLGIAWMLFTAIKNIHSLDIETDMILFAVMPVVFLLMAFYITKFPPFAIAFSVFPFAIILASTDIYRLLSNEFRPFNQHMDVCPIQPRSGYIPYLLSFYLVKNFGFPRIFQHMWPLHLSITFICCFSMFLSLKPAEHAKGVNITVPAATLAALSFSLCRHPISLFSIEFPILAAHYLVFPSFAMYHIKKQYRALPRDMNWEAWTYFYYVKNVYVFGNLFGLPAQILYILHWYLVPKNLPFLAYYALTPDRFSEQYVSADEDKEFALWNWKDQLKPKD